MVEKLKEIRSIINSNQLREKVMGLFCLTVIAIIAMVRLEDPENILINIIIAIAGILNVASSTRRSDPNNPKEPL